jgi:hypothetical protein
MAMRYLVALETSEQRRDGDAIRVNRWTRGRIAVTCKKEADLLSDLINQHRHGVFGHKTETIARVCVQVHTSRGSVILDYTTSPDYQQSDAA